MERVRAITRHLMLPLLLLTAGFSLGCASTEKMQQSFTNVKQSLHIGGSEPATQVLCFWQRRLRALPDPIHDGTQIQGITGQVFFLTGTEKHATADGDLAIVAYDETARPTGQPAKKPEMWHITKDTLARLRTKDDRLGPCYALFLPWPQEWNDVTAVKLLARYQSPGRPDLYAEEVKVTIDFSTPGTSAWSDVNGVKSGVSQAGGTTSQSNVAAADTRSVPDPSKILQDIRNGNANAPAAAPTNAPSNAMVPAGNWPQPTRNNVPTNWPQQQQPVPANMPNMNVVPAAGMQPNSGMIVPNNSVNMPQNMVPQNFGQPNTAPQNMGAMNSPQPQIPPGWTSVPVANPLAPTNAPVSGGLEPIIIRRQ